MPDYGVIGEAQIIRTRTIEVDPTLDDFADGIPLFTVTVSTADPLAGTFTLPGTLIRASPALKIPAS